MDNEISIVPFRYKYLKALREILKTNDSPFEHIVSMKNLPKTGYIALLNGYPVAAGFLRRVEGGYGQMDTLTSNRTYGSIIRHQALVKITDVLIEDAKLLRLDGILAFTEEKCLVERATAAGWTAKTQIICAKALT